MIFSPQFWVISIDTINDVLRMECSAKNPADDFSWKQIHDAGQVHKTIDRNNVGDIRDLHCIRLLWIELLIQYVFQF